MAPPLPREYSPETKLPNGITIHGSDDSEAVRRQAQVCNEFPSIFQDNGTFVDLPEEEWMKIDLKPGWEDQLKKGARVYPQGNEARAVIDETFDELYAKNHMS